MSHEPYIQAVVQALRDEDLMLTAPLTISRDPHRHARLCLTVPGATAFTTLQDCVLCWDDHEGWSVTITGSPGPCTTVYRGRDLVPHATVVAAWAALVLTMPAVVNDQRRDLPLSRADVDTLLAAHSANTRA